MVKLSPGVSRLPGLFLGPDECMLMFLWQAAINPSRWPQWGASVMRNRRRFAPAFRGVVSACVCFSVTALSAGAAEPDSFRVRTTEDLVKLCSAVPTDPNYVAAIHFCHGFSSGAYQYYESIVSAEPSERFVCPPNPPPTRSEAVAGFVAWAQANPQYMADRPVDSLFRYLSSRYPCGQ